MSNRNSSRFTPNIHTGPVNPRKKGFLWNSLQNRSILLLKTQHHAKKNKKQTKKQPHIFVQPNPWRVKWAPGVIQMDPNEQWNMRNLAVLHGRALKSCGSSSCVISLCAEEKKYKQCAEKLITCFCHSEVSLSWAHYEMGNVVFSLKIKDWCRGHVMMLSLSNAVELYILLFSPSPQHGNLYSLQHEWN